LSSSDESEPVYDEKGNVIGEKFVSGNLVWTCNKLTRTCVSDLSRTQKGTDFPTSNTPIIDRLEGKNKTGTLKRKTRLDSPSLTQLLGGFR
jgi:hypothetical protein